MRRGRFRAVVLAGAFAVLVNSSSAQPVLSRQRQLLGAYAGYQGNFYNGNFNVYESGSACGVFQTGSGWRPVFGVIGEWPISRKVNLAPRLLWDNRSGVFTTTHDDNSALVNGQPAIVDMEHELTVTLRQISLDVPFKWTPFPRNNLHFLSGLSFGYILSDSYTQTQSIISPSNAYFKENGRQVRTLASGTFQSVQHFQYGLCLGAGYDLPVGKKMFLAPEILSMFGLNSVVGSPSWTIITLKFAASLKADVSSWFRDELAGEPIEDLQQRQEVNPYDNTPGFTGPTATISVMGLTPDGDQTPHPTLKVEEFLSTDLQPVLNYIFFSENSADIPSRYAGLTPEQAAAFTDTALIGAKTMELYYQTLNIVGRRMIDHPKANLRVVGCNSNEGVEAGNVALSGRRAQSVAGYLANVWKIDPSRIRTSAQNLPDDPSRAGEAFGNEENRRAELWSDDPQVLSPVTLAGFERTATPPKIRMYMHSDNAALIDHWRAEAVEEGKVIAHIEGAGKIPATFDWILTSLADTLIHNDKPVQFSLTVFDSAGNANRTETAIQLQALTIRKKREQRIADKRVDKFSLFLFDFDQSTLSRRSEAVLKLVEKAVAPASTVAVIGFTDRTGEADHNLQLSQARAQTVASHIDKFAHPAHITSDGRGDTELLFDNALPEGRYFCRTVYVRVETPVE